MKSWLASLLLLCAGSAAAQGHEPDRLRPWEVGAQAIGLVTHATPALDGESMTEGYLTQPAVMGHVSFWDGHLTASAMLNLEGWTLRRGELNAGIWGEGYIDRRHPHTFLHELVVTGQGRLLGVDVSATAGKGFVPFGTDDPMVRPFVKYPVNHHLAQILERGVLVAAARRGPVLFEAGIFNGDEPSKPEDFVNWERFGDSWSTRATLLPIPGAEISASYASVASPEFPAGSGLNHRKRSVAARWEGRRIYALAEWARTDEYIEGERSASFRSVLGEAALVLRGTELAVRYERTVRPEEERTTDPFRSPRPHGDIHYLGATRWNIVTAAVVGGTPSSWPVQVRPFAEVAYARATETLGSLVFDPEEFYGSDRMWSLSAGVRVAAGSLHSRMGRYGVAVPRGVAEHPHH